MTWQGWLMGHRFFDRPPRRHPTDDSIDGSRGCPKMTSGTAPRHRCRLRDWTFVADWVHDKGSIPARAGETECEALRAAGFRVNPRACGGDAPRSQSWPPNGDRLFLPIHAGYRYLSSLAQTEHLPFIAEGVHSCGHIPRDGCGHISRVVATLLRSAK